MTKEEKEQLFLQIKPLLAALTLSYQDWCDCGVPVIGGQHQ